MLTVLGHNVNLFIRLYSRCIGVLREVASIEAEVGTLAGGSAGRVRIGLMPALTRYLPRDFDGFRARQRRPCSTNSPCHLSAGEYSLHQFLNGERIGHRGTRVRASVQQF